MPPPILSCLYLTANIALSLSFPTFSHSTLHSVIRACPTRVLDDEFEGVESDRWKDAGFRQVIVGFILLIFMKELAYACGTRSVSFFITIFTLLKDFGLSFV